MRTMNRLSILDLKAISKTYQEEAVRIRRHLHEHPELSWEEIGTIAFLKEEIKKLCHLSTELQLEEKKGGLVCNLVVDASKKTILFRADIDALAIYEETNLPFSSKNQGVMHACGHDFHTAMLLTALKIIIEKKLTLAYNLRIVFQRAEENPLVKSGGESLVEEGVVEGVDFAVGLHIDSKKEVGEFSSKKGALMANACSVYFKIKCLGGHVMNPERGSNAIDILTDIHLHLRGFILCNIGPNEPIAFVPAISSAGSRCNIMPNEASACYSFRNFLSEEKKRLFIDQLKKRLELLVELYPHAKLVDFYFSNGYPVLENDEEIYLATKKVLDSGYVKTTESSPLFAGEDFAYYLKKVKGAFWVLGAKQDPPYDHHTSYFNPSEESLWIGVFFWLLIAQTSIIEHHD